MAEQPAKSNGESWYEGGLRFACTQCGNCCSGPPGYVWFTEAEGDAIARHLGVTRAEFLDRYARRFGRRWTLKDVNIASASGGKDAFDCIFLDRQSQPGKAACSIYSVRPQQCRTWPFWPENLSSKREWDGARRRTPCPGMDSGSLIPIDRIRILRDTTDS